MNTKQDIIEYKFKEENDYINEMALNLNYFPQTLKIVYQELKPNPKPNSKLLLPSNINYGFFSTNNKD